MASETYEPPSGIINRELSQNLPQGYLGYIQKDDTLKQTIQQKRKRDTPALPKTLNDINLSGAYALSAGGEQFVLCNESFGEKRIICFATNQNMRYLCTSKV